MIEKNKNDEEKRSQVAASATSLFGSFVVMSKEQAMNLETISNQSLFLQNVIKPMNQIS
jgi:hypothetical protein